ncbi:MAG: bifunctional enoyl-CoA hydratase/phosphate acetyltransferase [Caldiserica bacterium]|jgi:phosphate butyryltransferase|nr:bifunctional enoyl-CoA hydratase/phosphate acetyltransferase [Caldisericota bacterium]MDH7562929.1 bifunctional enoyl-CoA hydratase/phosphate acetyltransferase [Caldisericota bacterium]
MIRNFAQALSRAKELERSVAVVVCPEEEDTLKGIEEAREMGLIAPHLFGNKEKIISIARNLNIDLEGYSIEDCPTPEQSALKAVEFCREANQGILIKGFLPTPVFLKAVLHKEKGLVSGQFLSHVAIFQVPGFDRLLFLTDGGMVVLPNLSQKLEILKNAVSVCHALGISLPKVALLASLETINQEIPSTTDAAIISGMWRRKQVSGCIVDGPLALDNALSPQALKEKGIESPVEGQADILLVPNIEAGNLLGKSLVHIAGGVMAGVVQGASVPIVLVSRVDPPESKLFSIAVALLIQKGKKSN